MRRFLIIYTDGDYDTEELHGEVEIKAPGDSSLTQIIARAFTGDLIKPMYYAQIPEFYKSEYREPWITVETHRPKSPQELIDWLTELAAEPLLNDEQREVVDYVLGTTMSIFSFLDSPDNVRIIRSSIVGNSKLDIERYEHPREPIRVPSLSPSKYSGRSVSPRPYEFSERTPFRRSTSYSDGSESE